MLNNIHLRGLDNLLLNKLKHDAASQHVSMNTFILNVLRKSVGLAEPERQQAYQDMDELAGTWKPHEATALLKNISYLEKVDKDLWK